MIMNSSLNHPTARASTTKELAASYGVSAKCFRTWLKPHLALIGQGSAAITPYCRCASFMNASVCLLFFFCSSLLFRMKPFWTYNIYLLPPSRKSPAKQKQTQIHPTWNRSSSRLKSAQ